MEAEASCQPPPSRTSTAHHHPHKIQIGKREKTAAIALLSSPSTDQSTTTHTKLTKTPPPTPPQQQQNQRPKKKKISEVRHQIGDMQCSIRPWLVEGKEREGRSVREKGMTEGQREKSDLFGRKKEKERSEEERERTVSEGEGTTTTQIDFEVSLIGGLSSDRCSPSLSPSLSRFGYAQKNHLKVNSKCKQFYTLGPLILQSKISNFKLIEFLAQTNHSLWCKMFSQIPLQPKRTQPKGNGR